MLSCPKCGRRYGEGQRHCSEDGTPLRADETLISFSACDPMIGHVLDEKYRLDEWLGEGGMGTVYRATHLLIDRPVAVKVLHSRFVEDDAAQQRFRREARAAGRLQHPNAVAVTDFGRTSEGCVYIVMELLEGRTLREVLSEEAPLSNARTVELMTQIAGAVEAAHEGGVIHRDLKPANIFIVQRKGAAHAVKVLDFGIAKLAADSLDDSDAKNLTQTGVMIGTPRYMSPEQCDGEKLSPASDVYSLGIILYEMLTGETPFNGASPLAVALQHSSKPPRPPREIAPSIPSELERVVLHALAKKPQERPADAGAFREELTATARRLGLATPEPVFSPPRPAPSTGSNGNGGDARDNPHVGDERRGVAEAERRGVAEAETPTPGRLVVDLDPSPSRVGEGARKTARSGETTVLADTSARVSTSEQRRSTGSIPAGATASEFVPAPARAFTRLQILLRGRRTPLGLLRQPPVLIALVLAALVFAAVAASVIHSRVASNTGGADAVASPSPSVEATPQPSPTATEEQTDKRTGKSERGKEEGRPARGAKGARQTPRGNPVMRTLKKIFKNPF